MTNFSKLFQESNSGRLMCTAYDTAWSARLGEMDWELSSKALNWISENQLSDGSWGAGMPMYYHDRVISTLAAMILLATHGRRAFDKRQIEHGLSALEIVTAGATKGLAADPNGATAGFEMIVPTLVAEAEKLGIIKQQGDRILSRLARQRIAKMEMLRGLKINKNMTMAFSTEMVGPDGWGILNIDQLQEADGSIRHSPSATAFYAKYINNQDTKALDYLRSTVRPDGGMPFAFPFGVTERAWVLWNISLVNDLDEETLQLCQPHLDYLQASWTPGKGVGFTQGHSVADGDDTSLTFEVLTKFKRTVDIETLMNFEEVDHFRCYPLETTFSPSNNIHFLGAFRLSGMDANHPLVQKAISFLLRTRQSDSFWLDKWHVSPLYTTSHVVINCSGYYNDLAKNSVNWIQSMQRADGSWGYYDISTAEETAYALQALCIWQKEGGNIPKELIHRGAAWLAEHIEPPYPAFWIAKTLNYSAWVVEAEIHSALALAESITGTCYI